MVWHKLPLARCSSALLVDHQALSKYQPQAIHGDLMREAASTQVLIDRLRSCMNGSIEKPRISLIRDMTKAWNDHKLEVLMNLFVCSTSIVNLTNEAIIITTQANEESRLKEQTESRHQARLKKKMGLQGNFINWASPHYSAVPCQAQGRSGRPLLTLLNAITINRLLNLSQAMTSKLLYIT